MKHISGLVLIVASMMSLGASAQWLWLDKDGRKVFSDRAPPASVPDKNILQKPGQLKARTQADSSTDDTAKTAAAPASNTPKLSELDKELAEKKKKAELAEEAKIKAEEEKIKKSKAENCERAKLAKANFDSGVRIARMNKQGEREVMDDAARAAETKRIQGIMDADCK